MQSAKQKRLSLLAGGGLVPLSSQVPQFALILVVLGLTPLTILLAWLVLRREI